MANLKLRYLNHIGCKLWKIKNLKIYQKANQSSFNITYTKLFLRFVNNTKGIKKVMGILMIFYLDTFLMLSAVTFGSLNFYLLKKKY